MKNNKNNKFINRIIERKKYYSKKSQRAEILKRNVQFRNHFLETYAEIKNEKEFFSDLKALYEAEKTNKLPPYTGSEHFEKNYNKWSYFCRVWHISSYWDAKLDTLEFYIRNPVRIIYHERPDYPTKGYLSLEIDGWTTLDDIRTIWTKIEKYQSKYLQKKVERRSNFGRDLCWHDLFHEMAIISEN